MNGPYAAPLPSTAAARETAEFLLEESTAHRIDPILSCTAEFDHVDLTVDPARRNVFETWGHLLRVGHLRFDDDADHVTGVGHWGDVMVSVRALHVSRWWDQ